MRKFLSCLFLLAGAARLSAQTTTNTAATTPTVSFTSVTTMVCAEDVLKIYYRVSAPFDAGNQFTVELSDANGSFAAPIALRTFTSSKAGVVSAPAPPLPGSGYRIRFVSSAPVTTSADNGADITIKGLAVVNPVPNQVLCAFFGTDPVTFTGTGSSYTWTNDNASVGLGNSGSGNIPDFISTNSTGQTQTARIRVRPEASANLCAGKAMVFVYKVKPFPEITNPLPDQFFCRGQVVPALNFTSNVAGASFVWENDNTGTGLPAGGNGALPSFVAAAGAGAITSEIIVYASANGCDGDAVLFRYQVDDCRNTPAGNRSAYTLRNSLTLGPNPATNSIRLHYNGALTRLTVEVRDSRGRTVLAPRSFSNNSIALTTESLFPGTYYALVRDPASGDQVSLPFVKL